MRHVSHFLEFILSESKIFSDERSGGTRFSALLFGDRLVLIDNDGKSDQVYLNFPVTIPRFSNSDISFATSVGSGASTTFMRYRRSVDLSNRSVRSYVGGVTVLFFVSTTKCTSGLYGLRFSDFSLLYVAPKRWMQETHGE